MPRLLPAEWIKLIAINYLLQLYEKEPDFMQEWEKVKRSFVPLIERTGTASSLIYIEHLLLRASPHDLVAWISDLQKLRQYVKDILGTSKLSDLEKIYDSLQGQLLPYIQMTCPH